MPPMNSAMPGLAAILLLASGLAATAQESGDAAAGARFARTACGPCHAIEPGQASSPNADAPAFQVIANMPSMTGTVIERRISRLAPPSTRSRSREWS